METEKVNPFSEVLRWLWLPSDRAPLSVDKIVMGVGGVLVPLGLARLFAGSPLGLFGDGGLPGAFPFFLAAFFSLGLAALLFFAAQVRALRPAGYAVLLTAVALLVEAISRLGETPKGTLGVFLFTLVSLGLFAFPKTRHAVFLGAMLFSGWRFIVSLISGAEFESSFVTTMNPALNLGISNWAAGLSVFLAAGCLAAVWFLDRNDAPGLARPFAAVGIVIAASSVLADSNFVVSLQAFMLAGAAVWVGVDRGRRAVAWAGAAGMVLAGAQLYDGFNNRIAGFVLILVGLGLLGFAARNQLPAVAKAIGSVTSNSAVLPASTQPGQRQPGSDLSGQPLVEGVGPVPGPGEFVDETASPLLDLPPAEGTAEMEFQAGDFHDPELEVSEYVGDDETFGDYPDVGDFESPNGDNLYAQGSSQPSAGAPLAADLQFSEFHQPYAETTMEAAPLGNGNGSQADPSQSDPEPTGETQLAEPNWYADPTERYDHRWHDGVNWTEHVATAGNSAVDPISY